MRYGQYVQYLLPKQHVQFSQWAKRTFYRASIVMVFGSLMINGHGAVAQSNSSNATANNGRADRQFTRPKFSPRDAKEAQQQPWKFEGRLHLQKGSTEGYIVLQIDLAPGHYIYSVSPEGSPAPTKIEVVPSASVQTADAFSPDQPPLVVENDTVFQRRIEKHTDRVQFFVPCRLDPNADYKLTGLPVIEFNGQVCSKDGVCMPIRQKRIQVSFAGYFQQESEGQSSTETPDGQTVPSQASARDVPANPTR